MTEETKVERDQVIEECASVVDGLLHKDEATAQQWSVMAGHATDAYRRALEEAATAIRAMKAHA